MGIIVKNSVDKSLLSQVSEALSIYGQSVILNRAVPDFRDGLKPVHRRILWTFYKLRLNNSGPYKKSARTVGDCVGQYHPHGDGAVYEALVNMCSQIPQQLVAGEGNFGDHYDGAAAMRYCFTGDTLIQTEEGLLRIDDIKHKSAYSIGNSELPLDLNVSSIGGPKKATKWIDSGTHTVFDVETVAGYDVTCTNNEPFYVLGSDLDYSWVPLSDLQVGDYLCISKTPMVSPTGMSEFAFVDRLNAPRCMTEELASLLGELTVNSTYDHDGLHIYNSSTCISDELRHHFPHALFNVVGDKLVTKSTTVIEFLKDIGLYGNRQGIPDVMWCASTKEVSAFIKRVFNIHGIGHNTIKLLNDSVVFLNDIKYLLLAYYGVVSSSIYFSGLKYYISIDRFSTLKFTTHIDYGELASMATSDCVVDSIPSYIIDNLFNLIKDNMEGTDNGLEKDLDNLYDILLNVKTFKSLHGTVNAYLRTTEYGIPIDTAQHIIDKVALMCDHNFFHVKISSITKVGNRQVYDLTVPETNAFVANGFVVHNTESKLSKYADMFLLDPDYLKVAPMVSNYSDDTVEPVYLPSKVPNLLINGSEGIAVGISQNTPSFSFASVAKCTVLALAGKLTAKKMAKLLRFKFTYGGSPLDTDTGLLDLCEYGKGPIEFIANYSIDWDKQTIMVTSSCPRLTFYKLKKGQKPTVKNSIIESLYEVDGVSKVTDETGTNAKTGEKEILIVVRTARRTNEKRFKEIVDEVCDKISTKVPYNVVVTERLEDGKVNFWQTSLFGIMQSWIKWRVDFERKVINYKIKELTTQIKSARLMIVALDNIEVIKRAFDVKNPVTFLGNELDITEDDAKTILEFRIRQLTKTERSKVLALVEDARTKITELKKDYKTPEPRIISDIRQLNRLMK